MPIFFHILTGTLTLGMVTVVGWRGGVFHTWMVLLHGAKGVC